MAARRPAGSGGEPESTLEMIVGFGHGSMRKSYYPELRRRLCELERFRTLFDAGHDLILLTRLPEGVVTDANLPACRRLGWPRSQILGQPLADFLDGGDLDALLAGETESAPAHLEMYFRCRDGTIFPVELTCRVAEEAGGDAATGASALIVARDISERRCFECELHAAKDKAERASLAKSKFLAAASHDLRQPAQSLTLFASLLGTMLEGHPAARVVEHLHVSVDALRLLLDGLLDVSRLDAGLVVPAPKAFSIGSILGPLHAEYHLRAAEKGLTLVLVPCRLWVLSDPGLLERILRNLLENAIRYTDTGRILIGCRRRGAAAAIEVRDTGVGMSADQMENVFEEFYQVGNPERDRAKGLGLGLAIVRRLERLLGHEVTVRSTPGRGSCFAVLLPQAAPGQAAAPAKPPVASCPGMSVLVIDDEAIVRTSLRMLLESWGCRVSEAASSEEAVVADLTACQFIVADYRLRGESGPDAIAAVQAAAGRAIPALILTGDTDPDRIAEANAQSVRVLHKPVTADGLRAAICGNASPAGCSSNEGCCAVTCH